MTGNGAAEARATAARATEWEYQRLFLPRGTSRRAAQRLLTDRAEYDHWELDRLRLYPDGSRRVWLRRKIIRQHASVPATG